MFKQKNLSTVQTIDRIFSETAQTRNRLTMKTVYFTKQNWDSFDSCSGFLSWMYRVLHPRKRRYSFYILFILTREKADLFFLIRPMLGFVCTADKFSDLPTLL